MQKPTQNEYCRFPKLEECAHFHYERVQLGKIHIKLNDEKFDPHNSNLIAQDANTSGSSTASQQLWFIIRVTAEKTEPFLIRRSFENMKMLDEMLHRCVYDRKISNLVDLSDLERDDLQMDSIVAEYLERFTSIVSDSLTCGQILSWFQLDNKGQRLPLADSDTMKSINTPAVGAAYGIRKYNAQACDEISIEVGDMISVIDMPSPAESVWWRGKKSHLQKSQYEVGFFPQSCVATIGDKVPRNLVLPAPLVGSLDVSPTKPVLRKHGKLIAFFRSFILSRPSRRCLKQSGIYKERVFSCDLSEHLLNSGQEIPMVLKVCSQFIEEFGIVDGIYRLSGITSNIQKLRSGFDEERVPDLGNPEVRQDIHAMSSLVKMYFRELPNPLCTYQLYEHFVEAIQNRGEPEERLNAMKETVQKLPPPHYRTLKYLMTHLNKIAQHSARTGMTDRNLAIVWAPNLLRSPSLEAGGVAALRGVGVQAVVTEYLITNCHKIFDETFESGLETSICDPIEDAEEVHSDSRDHELSAPICIERPKSLGVGSGARLISLEEAQNRHNRIEFIDLNKTNPMNTPGGSSSYIEVGGGPSSLPDKYHTVLPVPRSWQKRKTHSWKSLFSRGQRNSNSNELKLLNPSTPSIAKEIHRASISSPIIEDDKLKQITRSCQKKVIKSIDFGDGKPMEICQRSSSADSLRTAGHSRSVSHDSYFDLLQSPLRAVAVSPSREFSELGLNFDREEPEMRIFSESESLVSSPRVPREMQSRRVTRCRTDDSGAVNSVNPSPKKQPRLNLPNSKENQWNASNHNNQSDDGSLRKRTKVEERENNLEERQSLSDIQFIDSITPEHTITANTIYACAQVHNPPASNRTSILEETPTAERPQLRVSALDNKTNDKLENKESRFSYPGMGEKFSDEKRFLSRFSINDNNDRNRRSFSDFKHTNSRSSVGLVLSNSSPDHLKANENDHSKSSIPTPSSPSKSPHYSLLGESSSENSSTLNTPAFDMDMSSATQHFDQRMNEIKSLICSAEPKDLSLPMSTEDTEQNTNQNPKAEPINIRCDLSLDLEKSKMSIDDASPPSNKHNLNMSSTSNTPNFTQTSGSTSQSMTPSEFGYQNLNRASNAVSIESSPKSDVYETLEQAFANYEQVTTPVQSLPPIKTKSPIKATINITYKSPIRNAPSANFMFTNDRPISPDPNQFPDYEPVDVISSVVTKPLETSFDDNGVYEQLKFFKGAVSEVNHLLNNGNDVQQQQQQGTHNKFNNDLNTPQIVPTIESAKTVTASNDRVFGETIVDDNKSDSGDVLMPEQELTQDSLEFDANISMYENVHLRKSPNAYENINMRLDGKTKSLNIPETNATISIGKENSKPANFTVKQLANKFETSPIDAQPPFDFSKPFARKNCDTNRNSANPPNPPKAKNPQQQQLNKTSNFTRSLDENAFVREFGSSRSNEKVNRSTHQIPIVTNILTENSPIRRSMNDSTKPKLLNPPKRLPSLTDAENKLCKKENINETMSPAEIKITPTTENPISLIQHNVNFDQKLPTDDDRNATNVSNKVLSNFKLDRERIERIKEERRHQLNEKFRSESFKCEKENSKAKSKSKIELNELKDADKKISDSLQYKSKSRNEIYNKNDADSSLALMSGANDGSLGRVRSISDEKNQNDCTDTTTNIDAQSVAFRTRKFDRRSIDLKREQEFNTALNGTVRTSAHLQRDPVSPQISIRDVAALFESRSQNH
ncbi:GTPase-activating protein CdGAPr [Contarinia nasturtii]|uniref:GTPase-activating protein CdGAPr n=1 Tax=Contarinia nasturtii TaxID=265458 RepID=UPI0012D3FB5C|nr:GTPase-activating protein CdGAPr [Contarinia nasturtii]